MHFNKLPNSHENSFLPHYKIVILFTVKSLNLYVVQDSAF